MRFVAAIGLILTVAALPAVAATPVPAPLAKLHDLVGHWKCTYRGSGMNLPYDAEYAYQRNGHELREVASFASGGDEELITYDAQRHGWTFVVIDDQGTVTVMHSSSSDPNHYAYRSVYPDASIAVRFDRVSATEYTLHGTFRSGGKSIASVDSCLRGAP